MQPTMQKVITYSSPSGEMINLTPKQIKALEDAGHWPSDWRGEQFCQVSHGLHWASPTYRPQEFRQLLRQQEPTGVGTGIITWDESRDGQGQLFLHWIADDGTESREVIEWDGYAPHEPGAEATAFADAFGGFDQAELDGEFVHVANI